jgi:hypothetical protein
MDRNKIRKALSLLGLSEDQITALLARIAKHNRGSAPVPTGASFAMKYRMPTGASQQPKEKPRKIILSYRAGRSDVRTVADEIEALRERLQRASLPDWQRRHLQARLDALLRTGKTHSQLAGDTMSQMASKSSLAASEPIRRDAGAEVGLGKIAAKTLAGMGQ